MPETIEPTPGWGKKLHLAIAEATKNRIIISVVDRLLNITGQPLWQNMRRLYYESDHSRIDQMLDIHDRIVRAVQQRNSHEAILALEADFDTVIEQLYTMNSIETSTALSETMPKARSAVFFRFGIAMAGYVMITICLLQNTGGGTYEKINVQYVSCSYVNGICVAVSNSSSC